ncbi:hypothetical protein D9M68_921310 [compost metagenome]
MLKDFLGHRIDLQDTAALVEHYGCHRQAADRLGIQLAQRLAAIQLIVHAQRTTQVRQEHVAKGTFFNGEFRRRFGPGNTKT